MNFLAQQSNFSTESEPMVYLQVQQSSENLLEMLQAMMTTALYSSKPDKQTSSENKTG